jgi:hypothetical protein
LVLKRRVNKGGGVRRVNVNHPNYQAEGWNVDIFLIILIVILIIILSGTIDYD